MSADLSRLPSGTGGWVALVDHALALGDLSEVDYLELKGALSFAERHERKRSAVVLSRAILGMANRMPDLAEKHLNGAGVVFVGIDQSQALVGAESVDGAVLRDLVELYVGEDGPTWDHQFIDHPDGLVLAVIVDAPAWGDRIHACRKDYSDDSSRLAVRDGDVLVRVPGKTRPATSHDLANLERRRAKAPHTGAQVDVSYAGAFDRTSRTSIYELIKGTVDAKVDRLLDDVPVATPQGRYSSGIQAILEQTSGHIDRRSPEQFRAAVEQWREECRATLDDVVWEFLRHTLSHGTFVIRNESDRYLENVRVQVSFPPDVSALMASDTDYCDHGGQFRPDQMLPDPPAKYGDLRPYGLDYASLMPGTKSSTALSGAAPTMNVEVTSTGCVVSWFVGDLPPRAVVNADEEFAITTDENAHVHNQHAQEHNHEPMRSEIAGAWAVTARGVDHVFQGVITVTCRQAPGEILVWRRGNPGY